jgi:hypothetical protein
VKPISGRAIASRFTASMQAAYSARAERRNLRRAGTLANSSSTVMRVPGGSAARPLLRHAAIVDDAQPAVGAPHPAFHPQARHAGDRGQGFAPEAERRDCFDASSGSFDVACRSSASAMSGRHPAAVVATSILSMPPPASEIAIRVAPASIAFSTNSFKRAGGPFDHFASGDSINEMFGESAY